MRLEWFDRMAVPSADMLRAAFRGLGDVSRVECIEEGSQYATLWYT
jgi:hypothetical protein